MLSRRDIQAISDKTHICTVLRVGAMDCIEMGAQGVCSGAENIINVKNRVYGRNLGK